MRGEQSIGKLGNPLKTKSSNKHAELARIKRDNARMEEEVAFLKKAAAYFAKQPK
jgi:transposase-like protein